MLVKQSQKANGSTWWNSRQICRCGPTENSEWKTIAKDRRFFFDTLSHKHNRKSLPVSGGNSNIIHIVYICIVILLQSHLPHGSDCRTAGTLIWLHDQSSQHPTLFSLSDSMPIYILLQRHRFISPVCSWRFTEYIHKCKRSFGKKYVHTGSLQRKYDVQNRLSFQKRVDSHLNKHLQWVCSMWRASILLAFLAKFSMDKSTWPKTTSLSPRRLKLMSNYLICIEVAWPYLLIHKIIQRSGVFNCHNYCKSSTDHTSQPWVSFSHDLLIPRASTGLQTAKQPSHSAVPVQNSVKGTCSPLSHQQETPQYSKKFQAKMICD